MTAADPLITVDHVVSFNIDEGLLVKEHVFDHDVGQLESWNYCIVVQNIFLPYRPLIDIYFLIELSLV